MKVALFTVFTTFTVVFGFPASSPRLFDYQDPTLGRTPAWNACAVCAEIIQSGIDLSLPPYEVDSYPYGKGSKGVTRCFSMPSAVSM
jgi:hypothetical protein